MYGGKGCGLGMVLDGAGTLASAFGLLADISETVTLLLLLPLPTTLLLQLLLLDLLHPLLSLPATLLLQLPMLGLLHPLLLPQS